MGAARGGRRALAFRGAAGERGSELRLRASAGFGLAGRRGGDCAGPDRRNSLAVINLNSVKITYKRSSVPDPLVQVNELGPVPHEALRLDFDALGQADVDRKVAHNPPEPLILHPKVELL